jgi:hypothetical protein
MKENEKEKEKAIADLRQWIQEGGTVYTILRHCSRSGLSRSISLFVIKDNQPIELDYWAAKAIDYKIDRKNGGLIVTGTGMDMGFHLVYSLSYAMFGNGYKLNHKWI